MAKQYFEIWIDFQGRHSSFLTGKDAIVAPTPLFSISQNPAKDQALAALPPVVALCIRIMFPQK